MIGQLCIESGEVMLKGLVAVIGGGLSAALNYLENESSSLWYNMRFMTSLSVILFTVSAGLGFKEYLRYKEFKESRN